MPGCINCTSLTSLYSKCSTYAIKAVTAVLVCLKAFAFLHQLFADFVEKLNLHSICISATAAAFSSTHWAHIWLAFIFHFSYFSCLTSSLLYSFCVASCIYCIGQQYFHNCILLHLCCTSWKFPHFGHLEKDRFFLKKKLFYFWGRFFCNKSVTLKLMLFWVETGEPKNTHTSASQQTKIHTQVLVKIML